MKTLFVFAPSAGRRGALFDHGQGTTEAEVSVDILAGPSVFKTLAFLDAPAGTSGNALRASVLKTASTLSRQRLLLLDSVYFI